MIGSLLYLMATRPDIQFIVCLCAWFQSFPRSSHWITVLRIFKYLKHTHEFGILLLRLILLTFLMLILWIMGLTKRALLVHAIFSDFLLFASLLENNLQLLNPPQRLSM
jgi:hypothetical protein